MGEWLQSLPVGWMALVVFTLTCMASWAILAIVMRLARSERYRIFFKGISPGMLPPLGIIFGLMVAFVASQVWNDMDHAKAAVNREASELSTIVFLAASFPGETETRLRDLTRRHIEEAVAYEWPMMAVQSESLAVTPVALAEELQLILAVVPQGAGQATAQREIVAALEDAIDARRQRIIVSRSSVNWVKWTALLLQALCTLTAIAMIHCDNRGAAAAAMGIFAIGISVSILLIASHDRPFTGEISVQPDLLRQVMPEEAATQDAIDRTVLLHLTGLLRSATQVVSDRPGEKDLNGKKLVELVRAKYAEQTGHPVPNLDPASAEGQLLQAGMDAIQEVADDALPLRGGLKRFPPSVFADRVADRFDRKAGQLAYVKWIAASGPDQHRPQAPDDWEDRTMRSRFQSAGWKKGDFVEQEAPLNGRKAYRVLIPEYYDEPRGSNGKPSGVISAAVYLK